MKTRVKINHPKKKRHFIFYVLALLVLSGAGYLAYSFFSMDGRLAKCLHYDFTEKQEAGAIVPVKISCNNPKLEEKIATITLHYTIDGNAETLTLENNQGEWNTWLPTEYTLPGIEAYFTLMLGDEQYKYPKVGNINIRYLDNKTTIKANQPEHAVIAFEKLRDGQDEQKLELLLPVSTAVENIELNYSSNNGEINTAKLQYLEVRNNLEEHIAVYAVPLENLNYDPTNLKKFTYNFQLKGANTLIFPENEVLEIIDPKFTSMQTQLNNYLNEHSYDIVFQLSDPEIETWSINAGEVNNGLSTIKMYVMGATYNQLEKGSITLTTPVSRYGYKGTVKSALQDMIIRSSNEATGALILAVGGTGNINTFLKETLGADIKSLISHTPGYAEGGSNRVTMEEEVEFLNLIVEEKLVSASASQEMLNLMRSGDKYYQMKKIEGINTIAIKEGYNPPYQYGLVAYIETAENGKYTVAFQVWQKNWKANVPKSSANDIMEIIQGYYQE